MSDETGLAVWNRVLGAALMIPGARVDRTAYLRNALRPHLASDQVERAIETTPAKAGISRTQIDGIAESAIRWHRTGVSAASAVSGLPGGWWIAATIPADLSQYFWHMVVVLQKLAYLYGWPSLFQEDEDVDDETRLVLTLFLGVMLGAHGATEGISRLAAALSAEVVKRVPRAALTRYALYNIAKQVARWLGVSLTKRKFAELLGKSIPILGGLLAGTLTWFAFGGGARRLRAHLAALPLAGA